MHDQMLNAMSKDLGVYRYVGENEKHYVCRVLYSGMACWIKTTALDTPLSESHLTYDGVSKKHIHDKCTKVLSEFISRFPSAEEWFYGEDHDIDPVSLIRQRLFGSGDIIDMGFQTNVGLVKSSEHELASQLSQVKGIILSTNVFYSGVSALKHTPSGHKTNLNGTQIDSKEWLLDFIDRAWWESGAIDDGQVEFFDARQKAKNNMSWKSTQPDYISGLVLCRRPINKSSYQYILQKRSAGRTYHHRLDPFLQEMREYRRIIFALRVWANNPAPAVATVGHHDVHLSMRVHLPNKEQQLLETFAWPHASIEDRLEWDMPHEVWLYIKEALLCLGLDVTEDIHG